MVVKAALVFAVSVVLLRWCCNVPVPEDISQPRVFASTGIIVKTVLHLAKIGEFFGVGTEPQNFRNIFNAIRMLTKKFEDTSYREGLTCTDATFNGVQVRVFEPVTVTQSGGRPGLVYIRGGGWVVGNDGYDTITAHLAKQLGIVVVSVVYRLAPEHKFPAAFDDCVAATRFFLQNAEKYNVDPAHIGISGDSAGGNLAAAVTLALAKEKNLPKLKTQALIYPALQAIDFNTPSYVEHGHLWPVPKDLMVSFWLWYLNGDVSFKEVLKANKHTTDQLKKSQYTANVDHKLVRLNLPLKAITNVKKEGMTFPAIPNIATILDPRFAPLMADDSDLKGLPPTYMLTCEYDVLRDDGVMYATRLEKTGVQVQHVHYETGFHGLLSHFEDLELAATAIENLVMYLKTSL